jgi:imidazolonepropionase
MIKTYVHLSQLVTLKGAHQKDGRHLIEQDLSIIPDGAIVFNHDEIIWLGKTSELPAEFATSTYHLGGHVLTPELVDSHTHLVFGGDRSQEYTERLNGTPYEVIAEKGGGILFTMRETGKLSADELFDCASERIETIASYGVGTIEVKSGYGLSFQKEKEISLVIDRLKKRFHPRIQIFNTFMAAHDAPSGFTSSAEYMNLVVLPLLKELAPLNILDAVDIFHEKKFFTEQDCSKLFLLSKIFNIPRKIHADELNDNNGTELAVSFDALSADHLLKVSDKGIAQLASSSTVATLLPGTAFFLGKTLAPAKKMLDAGVKVALASDYNPGSCHCDNLLLIASLAAANLKMNQAQLWSSITLNAAHALGLKNQGALRVGMKPRFSLFKVPTLSHITYHWGKNFSVNLP